MPGAWSELVYYTPTQPSESGTILLLSTQHGQVAYTQVAYTIPDASAPAIKEVDEILIGPAIKEDDDVPSEDEKSAPAVEEDTPAIKEDDDIPSEDEK